MPIGEGTKRVLLSAIICGVMSLAGIAWTQDSVEISRETLQDKIRGAWAAQTIGVTYGFPVEFKFNSVRVPDDHELPWHEDYLFEMFTQNPNIYDDIYMDLSFVQVFEDEGLDASAESLASSFANAGYALWFANQVARYNVLNGLSPPESGHWINNPAADDIDFQIEADFIGLMAPGLPSTAVEVSDRVGHIMNYGDGWYGGVFIAVMYSLAFTTDDIEQIVEQAISVIPEESDFHQIISDVIALHEQNPDDWKFAWEGINKKWSSSDLGPIGLLAPFNIDAKINAAWVVLGLLYGDGDFARTIDIATRAGDDADCNPASAAGILGTIYGYQGIPDYWKQGLSKIENLDFAHTTISLNKAYDLSYRHALQSIERAGGSVDETRVSIPSQKLFVVPFEESFPFHQPKEKRCVGSGSDDPQNCNPFQSKPLKVDGSYAFEFEGNGFAVIGAVAATGEQQQVVEAQLYVDGELVEEAMLPTNYIKRRFYLFWRYALEQGDHSVEIKIANPSDEADFLINSLAIYERPAKVRDGK